MPGRTNRYPALKGREKADVAIVGGGLSGLATAVWLSRAGLRVALAEANAIGSGTTKACAGLVSLGGISYARLIKRIEKTGTEAYLSTNARAFWLLKEWLEPLHMWRQQEVHLLFSGGKQKLDEERCAQETLGIKGTSYTRLQNLYTMSIPDSALIPARPYLRMLLEAAEEQGVKLFEQSRVLSMETNEIHTQSGSMSAPYVVVTTGYPVLNSPGYYFLWLTQKHYAWKQLLPGMFDGVIAEDGGETVVISHGEHNRLICQCGLTGSRKSLYIANQAEERMKSIAGVRAAGEWHYSSDVFTPDGLPVISAYSPKTPGLFVASGYGGRGILGSILCAQFISSRILGLPCDEYSIYDGSRFWKQPWPVLCTAGRYVKSVCFHARAPRCPHLGCRLILNVRTKLWECPCHGSCFDDIGHVVRSPAVREAVLRDRK